MVDALGDLQIGAQHRHIQRGRGLAHAAADLVDDLVARIRARGLVAALGRALADHIVIGKLVARVEDGAVDRRRRQTHIVRARHVGLAQRGRAAGERIAEQRLLQLLCGHLGRRGRDRDSIGGCRTVPNDGARLLDIKLHAHLFRDDGRAVLLADRRADRVADHLGGDLVNVDRGRLAQLDRHLIRLEIHQADLFRQRLLDRRRVKADARLAGVNGHGIRADLAGGLDRLGQRLGGDLLERGGQAVLIHRGGDLRLI